MLMSQTEYGAHRSAKGLSGATQSSVSQALKRGRIKYAPGTTLIDPVQADSDWLRHTEPRPRRQGDDGMAAFLKRQAEPVNMADVLQALHDAYRVITAEYQALCSGLAKRTEAMTVRELDQATDDLVERLDIALYPVISIAFTGEPDDLF
jgi:hypothetical protein